MKKVTFILSGVTVIMMLVFVLNIKNDRLSSKGRNEILFREETAKKSVFPPWNPIEVIAKGDSIRVKCWGRDYLFKDRLLPVQIISQRSSMLNGPMEVLLKQEGETKAFSSTTIRVTEQNEKFVELEGSTNGESINIISKIHIEYDGLMQISLEVESQTSSQGESEISIVIPYKLGVADYFIKWKGNKKELDYSGNIYHSRGVFMRSKYTPYFWIGGDNIGLFWFCEQEANWPNSRDDNAIQLIGSNNTLIQKFNIGATEKYTFGLQATPVKPFPVDWREWRVTNTIHPNSLSNIIIIWPKPSGPYKYFAWPEAVDEAAFREEVKKYHSEGKKVLAYISLTRIPTSSELFKDNKSKWKIKGSTVVPNDTLVYVNPHSNDFRKEIVNQLTEFIKKYDLDGYYIDGLSLFPGFKGPGKGQYFPILAYRDLTRSLYTSLKEIDPNLMIVGHTSGEMNAPVLSYIDAYVDGEQFRYRSNGRLYNKVKLSYLEAISLSQFRAEFIGRQWGVVPIFLPELGRTGKNQAAATKALAALLLIHDVQPWPVASNFKVWEDAYAKLDKFGFTNASFIPYYSVNPSATTNLDSVYISIYKKNNGTALALISNLSNKIQTGKVQINANVLGWSIKEALVWPEGSTLSKNSNSFSLTIEPLNYKMILLEGSR